MFDLLDRRSGEVLRTVDADGLLDTREIPNGTYVVRPHDPRQKTMKLVVRNDDDDEG